MAHRRILSLFFLSRILLARCRFSLLVHFMFSWSTPVRTKEWKEKYQKFNIIIAFWHLLFNPCLSYELPGLLDSLGAFNTCVFKPICHSVRLKLTSPLWVFLFWFLGVLSVFIFHQNTQCETFSGYSWSGAAGSTRTPWLITSCTSEFLSYTCLALHCLFIKDFIWASITNHSIPECSLVPLTVMICSYSDTEHRC